jgi:hypothetical protein
MQVVGTGGQVVATRGQIVAIAGQVVGTTAVVVGGGVVWAAACWREAPSAIPNAAIAASNLTPSLTILSLLQDGEGLETCRRLLPEPISVYESD